jgi:hypothetical protein
MGRPTYCQYGIHVSGLPTNGPRLCTMECIQSPAAFLSLIALPRLRGWSGTRGLLRASLIQRPCFATCESFDGDIEVLGCPRCDYAEECFGTRLE